MATRIKLRRDTAANWLLSNPILAQGETGFETDSRAMKLGDGTTRWADLKYAVTGNLKVTDNTIHGDDVVSVSSGRGDRSNWVLTVNGRYNDDQPLDTVALAVAYDSEGNTFSIGNYGGVQAPPSDGMFLIKTDVNGEVVFSNYYNGMDAFGWSMIVDGNDDVIFVMAEFDSASADTILVKVSGVDGTFRWQKMLADTDPTSDDIALCVDVDPQNNVIIAGTTATGSGIDFWVGKFNGETGAEIWQRQYDSDGCEDSASGIAVDSEGNIGVVGSSYGPGTFLGLFKLDGTDGDVIWQKRVINANVQANEVQFGNAWVNGDLFSSDICVDSNNDFYFNLTGIYCDPEQIVAGIHKISGSGEWKWSKVINYGNYSSGTSAVICDSDNNVYLTATLATNRQINPNNDSQSFATVITKFNAAGRKIWGKSLQREQGFSTSAIGSINEFSYSGSGQSIAVNDDYILVGGNYFTTDPYYGADGPANDFYAHAYIAQLDKAGTDFVKDGWIFKDNTFRIFEMSAALDDEGFLNDLTELTADIAVTTGAVTFSAIQHDTYSLAYINTARAKPMTLDGARLHLPENGGLALNRKQIGHITSIGKFDLDGNEGNNTEGNTWINGVVGDAAGNIYASGGWYTNEDWNDGNDSEEIPLVWKIDSEGAIVWTAGNNLNQWGADMIAVAHNATADTVVALGHDNDDNLDNFDGAEGFNLFTLDASSGALKSVLHVRDSGENQSGSGSGSADMYPMTMALKNNGTPVVVGYINNAKDKFADVTSAAAGAPGSGDGILVINKSVFDRAGTRTDIEYPNDGGFWFIGSSAITNVNRYAAVASVNTTVAGTGAKFDVVLTDTGGGNYTAVVTVAAGFAGSGYKVDNRLTIAGTAFTSGASPDNDLVFDVATVGAGGTILTLTAGTLTGIGGFTGWGTYPEETATVRTGTGATFNITANPTTNAYTVVKASGGTGYTPGDTVKVLGSLLGGVDVTNDAVITITGNTQSTGAIDTITHTGTGQITRIKLDIGSGTDFTQAGTYNVWHETDSDAFIWTPDWHVAVGGEADYDTFSAVAVDSADNIIVGGRSDNLDLGSNTTDWDSVAQSAFIAKYNSAGVRQWAKAVDGHEGGNVVWGVTTDTDNNVYAVMNTNGNGPGNSFDPSVIKLDSSGNFVWMVQLNIDESEQNTCSIAMDADENIIISVTSEFNDTDYDRVGYDNQLLVAKFDKDGNPLWKRMLWTNNGIYTGYNTDYGNNLAVVEDRFVFGGYASAWNDDDDTTAVVAQLPVDGTGLGNHGNYYYEEVEIYIERWTENDTFGAGQEIVRDVAARLPSRQHALISETYDTNQPGDDGDVNGASGPMTIYADLEAKIAHVREEGGGDITGVKEIVFEDGTRQSTTAQDIPQVDLSITNRGDDAYWLRLEDRGHHIYMEEGSEGVDIVIPPYSAVPFPVGTSIVIVTGASSRDVYSDDNDDLMWAAGQNDSSYSWTIPQWSMVTLLKIRQGYDGDTPANSGTWMIAGPGLTSNNP